MVFIPKNYDFAVNQSKFEINFRDTGIDDVDLINIKLNGKTIRRALDLPGGAGESIEFELEPGLNTITFRALNEGAVSGSIPLWRCV
jgi:hypothetical protein